MSTEYRVVPVEPTTEMIYAASQAKYPIMRNEVEAFSICYRAMLGAAPERPAEKSSTCAKSQTEPAPPAGGEPEVIASVHGAGYSDHPPMTHWLEIGVEKMPMSGKIETGEKLIFLKDHRTHVTRLQAEVARLKAETDDLRRRCTNVNSQLIHANWELSETREAYLNQSSRLITSESDLTKAQESALLDRHEAWKAGELHGLNTVNAELTKARELLHKAGNLMWEMYLGSPTDKVCDAVEDFLNGPYGPPPDQSAPAAKDGE